MSAWLCSDKHISFMVNYACNKVNPVEFEKYKLAPMTRQELGQLLLDENIRSLVSRYGEEENESAHVFQLEDTSEIEARAGVGDFVTAVRCYCYQSCESSDWETTPAYEWTMRLFREAACNIKGSDDDTSYWGL